MMATGLMTWELPDEEGQCQVPPPTPRQPHNIHTPPVGCFMAPTDVLIVKLSWPMYFPYPPFRK